ncbi:MAG: diguanylate cyclase [Lachnospiraceae bacterium]|nr:diguanylate cyclase [Lachnospiraceae bacterium]
MKAIQTRIITLLVCCTFFVVAIVGFVGLGIMNRALAKDSTQIMQLMCAEQAGEFNESIHSVEQSVDTMHQMAVDGLRKYGTIFENDILMKEYLTGVKSVSRNLAENTWGSMAVYYRFNHQLTSPTAGFFSVKIGNNPFSDYPCTDLSLYEENDKEHVFWYYEPVNAGKAIWLDPYPNDNIGVEMISYVAPVFFEGQTIGIVGMDIDIVSWREKIQKIKLYDTGFAVLLDSKGNVVYHPEYPDGLAKEEAPETVDTINFYVQEALKQEDSDSYSYKLDAQERAMMAVTLDNGMIFAVVVPLKEVSAPSRTVMVQSILISVAIVIAFCMFSVRICKYILSVAYTDVMTGARNKTAYEDEVEEINQEIREKRAKFALVMFDINNLKPTNDTYGHDEGDKLIIVSVALMQKVFGKENVFRIGGDEFAVLLRHAEADMYQQKMKEFSNGLDSLNAEENFVWGDIKIARGATVYDFKEDAVYGDVFRRADALMYENKKKQKGQE